MGDNSLRSWYVWATTSKIIFGEVQQTNIKYISMSHQVLLTYIIQALFYVGIKHKCSLDDNIVSRVIVTLSKSSINIYQRVLILQSMPFILCPLLSCLC